MSEINDRINVVIESVGEYPNSFAKLVDVNPTVIHNIIKGRRSKPSFDLLLKILSTYKELSSEWLLRGEGSVWRKKSAVLKGQVKSKDDVEFRLLELVSIIEEKLPETYEVVELRAMLNLLIDQNDQQRKEMLRLNEKQEKAIETLLNMRKRY